MKYDEIGYEKKIKRDGLQVFEIQWAPYLLCKSKFEIVKKLTEMTGIYVVFYLNQYKRLTPLMVGAAWFTGLRPSVLRLYDDITITSLPRYIIDTVKDADIYIKYIEVYDLDDLTKMIYVLKDLYKDAYCDANGLEEPEDMDFVRIVDKKTKRYARNN